MGTVVTTPARPAITPSRPISKLLAAWHLLSLDAPCVAALWTIFFARSFGVALPWVVPAALALAVWMLYALDRTADAAAGHEALAERHHFHHHHRFAFIGTVLGAVPVLALMIALLPSALRTAWLLLALPLAIYVAAVHILRLRRLPKEHLVALFFAVATMMPVVASRSVAAVRLIPAMAAFGAICWLNCIAIVRWEHTPASTLDSVTAWSAAHFRDVIIAVLLAMLPSIPWQPEIAITCAASALLLLLLENTRPSAATLRALADAALLTPLVVLPFLRPR